MTRVWIAYEPLLYADVWAWLFENLESVEVINHPFAGVEVIIFPLDDSGQPQMSFLPTPLPEAKLVAVSPTGTCGLVRLPGKDKWHMVQPFGLSHLLREVQAGLEQSPVDIPQTADALPPPTAAAPSEPPVPAQARRIPLRQQTSFRATLFAAPIVLVFVTIGVVAASGHSLPGEPFYPVKRWMERVQLALASEAQQPRLLVTFAERRLKEVEALAGQSVVLPETLEDMANTTKAALAGVKRLQSESDREALLKQLAELARRQQDVLTAMRASLSGEAQKVLTYAWQVSVASQQEAIMALGISPEMPSPAENVVATSLMETPESTPVASSPATQFPAARPSAHPVSTPTVAPAPSNTALATSLPTLTPSRPPTESATAAPAQPRNAISTTSPFLTPNQPPTQTPNHTLTPTPTATPTRTPTPTSSYTSTRTPTRTPTRAPTDTPLLTPGYTPTWTATPRPTRTRTAAPTNSPMLTPSHTPTQTATVTPTPSDTLAPTETASPMPTPSDTPTDTATVMSTPSDTLTPTEAASPMPTPGDTPTDTATVMSTPSDTLAPTETASPMPTPGDTPTDTATVMSTPSDTLAPTETASPMPTPGDIPTETETPTLTTPSDTPTH